MPGPDPGAFGAVDHAAVPSVAASEVADAAFAAGSPFHVPPERSLSFLGLPGVAGSALARNDDVSDTEIVQVILDAGLAVAAVGGHRLRLSSGAADDPFDSGFQPRSIGRVARLHVVVEDDAVVVVDQLGLVAELDRFPEPALSDRPGVEIVQADLPGRTVGDLSGAPLPGLFDDLPGRVQQFGQIVHRPGQAATTAPRHRITVTVGVLLLGVDLRFAQSPLGVDQ